MLSIIAPASAQPYLDYTFSVVFDEWLGIDYQIAYKAIDNIQIRLVGYDDGAINLDTSFLSGVVRNELNQDALVELSCTAFDLSVLESELGALKYSFLEHDLPIIFGEPNITIDSNINIHFDLFGTIFFMLSRFEELVNPVRDKHDRFPASASLAFKYQFVERPIVDEYVEILWACMKKLWPNLERKRQESKIFVSCDVDTPLDPSVRNAYQLARTCFADLVKRRSIADAYKRLRRYVYNKKGDFRFDSNYTFDWYMDVCERAGLKAAFYFIPTSVEPHNGAYELAEPAIRELLLKIDSRGHEIGVHGSYQTFRDGEKLQQQKELFDKALLDLGIKQKVKGNRQHYLRWDCSITPDLLDEAGFEYDTTGAYADHAGFRFGTCHEFSMWSWAQKKQLKLKQQPLIVMECSVIDDCYMGLGSGEEAQTYINKLRQTCQQVGGGFSLLWHNSSLYNDSLMKCFRVAAMEH